MNDEEKTIVSLSADVDRQWADTLDWLDSDAVSHEEMMEFTRTIGKHNYGDVINTIKTSGKFAWLICRLCNLAINDASVRLMQRKLGND